MASIFGFITKEGKHFAPIANRVSNYAVVNGVIVEQGTKIVSGTKGTFAKVRLENTSTDKAELFASNTEFYPSSQ